MRGNLIPHMTLINGLLLLLLLLLKWTPWLKYYCTLPEWVSHTNNLLWRPSHLKTKWHNWLSHKPFGYNIINSCSQGPLIRPGTSGPEPLHFTSLYKVRDVFTRVCLTQDPCYAVQECTGVHTYNPGRAMVLVGWGNVEYQDTALKRHFFEHSGILLQNSNYCNISNKNTLLKPSWSHMWAARGPHSRGQLQFCQGHSQGGRRVPVTPPLRDEILGPWFW